MFGVNESGADLRIQSILGSLRVTIIEGHHGPRDILFQLHEKTQRGASSIKRQLTVILIIHASSITDVLGLDEAFQAYMTESHHKYRVSIRRTNTRQILIHLFDRPSNNDAIFRGAIGQHRLQRPVKEELEFLLCVWRVTWGQIGLRAKDPSVGIMVSELSRTTLECQ